MNPYQLPERALPDLPEEVRTIKRLAARCGRTLDDRKKHQLARQCLRDALAAAHPRSLVYWSEVVMIDHRWCGATGQGGFWAAASRCVNEEAKVLLEERRSAWPQLHGDALFAVVD